MRLLRRRTRTPDITPDLARVVAGYVAAGLAPDARGDLAAEAGRARASLISIGLTVANAVPDDITVAEILSLADRATVDRG